MSVETLIQEASKLSPADRLRIADALWESAWDEAPAAFLTAEQQAELDARLADYQANPDAGEEWSSVKARLESRL